MCHLMKDIATPLRDYGDFLLLRLPYFHLPGFLAYFFDMLICCLVFYTLRCRGGTTSWANEDQMGPIFLRFFAVLLTMVFTAFLTHTM